MIGEDAALALLERALSLSTAEQADVYLSSQDLGLTRFAGNAIHQNVSHSNVTLNIRAVEGQRLGRATTNDTSDDGIRRAMEAAKRNALLMPEDPAFPGLPEPQPAQRVASWDESAATCSPMTRAQMVGRSANKEPPRVWTPLAPAGQEYRKSLWSAAGACVRTMPELSPD